MTKKSLALSLVRAADDDGMIQDHQMVGLTTDPKLHTTCRLSAAAKALDVLPEVAAIMGWDDDDLADLLADL